MFQYLLFVTVSLNLAVLCMCQSGDYPIRLWVMKTPTVPPHPWGLFCEKKGSLFTSCLTTAALVYIQAETQ